MRASADGSSWTDWRLVEPDTDASGLVFFGDLQRYLEIESSAPRSAGLKLLFIDPGITPRIPPRPAPRDVLAPPIVSREQWGCTPQTCPVKSPPVYTTVTHLIVHHTAGANEAADWAAVVRSIWVLHVQGNGWNDIGYNYLIDPNGVLYEGRAGGDGVLGAHFSGVNSGTMGVSIMGTYSTVPAPAPARETLVAMLAWQAAKWHLDPTGKQLHASSGLVLDAVSGHRDANLSTSATSTTECPGNGLYTALPEIRLQVGRAVAGDCSVQISERALCVPAEGGTITTAVSAPAACSWSATAATAWIAAQPAGSELKLTVPANSGARRTASITVAGQNVTVTQAAQSEPPLPCVSFNGLVSAGSDNGRPAVAGSLVSIYGSNLAQEAVSAPAVSGVPLPTILGGVSVAIDGRPAALSYVSPTQINAQLPPATNIGSARAIVTAAGVSGPEARFSVTEATPAIFVYDNARAIAQNFEDSQLNGPHAPARPGSAITVYLTGAGAVKGSFPAAGAATPSYPLAPATLPANATIGGRPASILFLGLAPGMTGVYQANLLVPQDAPAGDQPLVITVSGTASEPALVSIAASEAKLK